MDESFIICLHHENAKRIGTSVFMLVWSDVHVIAMVIYDVDLWINHNKIPFPVVSSVGPSFSIRYNG